MKRITTETLITGPRPFSTIVAFGPFLSLQIPYINSRPSCVCTKSVSNGKEKGNG